MAEPYCAGQAAARGPREINFTDPARFGVKPSKISDMDFWDVFWILLIFLPLLLIWGFALVDIFRRDDMPGWLKAMWVVCVILAPFFGTLIYLIFRRPGATPQERQAMELASREFVAKYAPTDRAQQLAVLSDLHDRGKLTDGEFATEKARLMAEPTDAPAGLVTPPTAPRMTTMTSTSPTTHVTTPSPNARTVAPSGSATPGPTGI
jgi:hypothetical protein